MIQLTNWQKDFLGREERKVEDLEPGYRNGRTFALVYAALVRAKCGERTLIMVGHKDKRRVQDLVLTMEGFTLDERGLVRVEGV